MSIFNYLRKRKNTASTAKERLQIIISHERTQRKNTPDYLSKLQEEILEVIAKYVPVSREHVNVTLDRTGNNAILELNVTMPEVTEV